MAVLAPHAPDPSLRGDPRILRAVVDRRLRTLVPEAGPADELASALRYSLLAPGKRIRPILTVLAGWEIGAQDMRALDAGCALEMIHAASLILDDMPAMDDAVVRRGQPATHVRFGEDVAMLTSITLVSMGYATLAGMTALPGDARCRMIGILARAVGVEGLAGGQYADLRPASTDGLHAAAETNRRKTGALFSAAAEMASAIHGTSHEASAPVHRAVGHLGQAYQLLDDLADGAALGRDGRPEDDHKATVLSLAGTDLARQRLHGHLASAMTDLDPTGPLAAYVHLLFAGAGREMEPA